MNGSSSRNLVPCLVIWRKQKEKKALQHSDFPWPTATDIITSCLTTHQPFTADLPSGWTNLLSPSFDTHFLLTPEKSFRRHENMRTRSCNIDNYTGNWSSLKNLLNKIVKPFWFLTQDQLSLQYVPPDLCICTFVLEQSLSVRALQEMLAKSGQNSEEVSDGQHKRKHTLWCKTLSQSICQHIVGCCLTMWCPYHFDMRCQRGSCNERRQLNWRF